MTTVSDFSALDEAPDIATNLRRLRRAQGHSLDTLAKLSGVSRAMLGQIETGKSMPTVTLVWKISKALGVGVSTLVETRKSPRSVVVRKAGASLISSAGGRFTLRSLVVPEFALQAEFFELRIAAGHRQISEPRAAGTKLALNVSQGTLTIEAGDDTPAKLDAGDSMLLVADRAVVYSNPGPTEAIALLVIPAAERKRA